MMTMRHFTSHKIGWPFGLVVLELCGKRGMKIKVYGFYGFLSNYYCYKLRVEKIIGAEAQN